MPLSTAWQSTAYAMPWAVTTICIIAPSSRARTYLEVQEIITASNSYKFYIPKNPSNDINYNTPANGIFGPRETPIAQELFTMVTTSSRSTASGDCGFLLVRQQFRQPRCRSPQHATLLHQAGNLRYSLNGQEFLVPQGESYTAVWDRFRAHRRILSGTNDSLAATYDGRPW